MSEGNQSLNETISKLGDSLNQYSATALVNLTLPEFTGHPSQDVKDFIRKFKIATIALNDDLRCIALNRALTGSAHTWAKIGIKSEIAASDWSGAKKKLIERFAPPNQGLRYLEKLSKLRYNPSDFTLSSYIELYSDLYRKSYKDCTENSIIRGLSLNLSSDILKHFYTLSNDWIDFKSIKELMTLAKRVEHGILPYEQKAKAEESGTISELTKAIKNLQDAVIAQKSEAKSNQPESSQMIAAITGGQHSKPPNIHGNKAPYLDQGRNPRYANQYSQKRSNVYQNTYRDNQRNPRKDAAPTDAAKQPQEDKYSEKRRKYEAVHGPIPGPCWTCGGKHFNRHCPYSALN